MIACVSWVEVSIAFDDAWKFRCAVIKFTSSSVISTFERSKEPDWIEPKPSAPASPKVGVPEVAVSTKVALPICFKPFWLLKFARTILPKGQGRPVRFGRDSRPAKQHSPHLG